MKNDKNIISFIKRNRELFWHIPDGKIDEISHDVLVEYVINYGDYESVKELINLLGINKTAEVFYRNNLSEKRTNYNKLNRHYFKLYFDRHASPNIKSRAKGFTSVSE